MTKIELQAEPDDVMWPVENCCICRKPTKMWVLHGGKITSESVACCSNCAKTKHMEDLPSKKEWFDSYGRS